MAHSCPVCEIKTRAFSTRNFSDKNDIVKGGRHTPKLDGLVHKGKKFTRHFQASYYEKYNWLTGCPKLLKVFCWPCLLFSPGTTNLSAAGCDDLGNLDNYLSRHVKAVGAAHTRACFQLATFGKNRIEHSLNDQLRLRATAHNDAVRRNREVMKRLVSAVCLMSKQELSFRGHDESETSLNRGNYVEFLMFLSEFDPVLANHFSSNSVFSGLSSTIQNDIIDAVHYILCEAIRDRVDRSPFVAVLVDEATDMSNKSQLAVVLRVTVHGKGIQEYFVSLRDVSQDKRAQALTKEVKDVLDDYKVGSSRLVAQAYDGASVMASTVNGVQGLLRVDFPLALFVHCYGHSLNLVLSQGLQCMSECRIFFQTINGMATFFSTSAKRTRLLEQSAGSRLPRVHAIRWTYSSRVVNAVHEHLEDLRVAFDEIQSATTGWENSRAAAKGYGECLTDFSFLFLLEVFHSIFARTDVLYSGLQKKALDIGFCRRIVDDFRCWLLEHAKTFQDYWSSVVGRIGLPRKRFRGQGVDSEDRYRNIFQEIHDAVIQQIDMRFKSLKHMPFLALLNPENFELYSSSFPQCEFESLISGYEGRFDRILLKNELIVVYSSEEFRGKYPHQMLEYLMTTKTTDCLSQVFLLCSLALTVPVSTASVERSFSTMKRVKSYCRTTCSNDRLSKLLMLSIEKETLVELKSSSTFYDRVIDKFAERERRIQLKFQ